LAITEGYIVAYLLPPFYRKKVTLSKSYTLRFRTEPVYVPKITRETYRLI